MAGLVPAIHVFDSNSLFETWMPATSAGMTSQTLRGLVSVAMAAPDRIISGVMHSGLPKLPLVLLLVLPAAEAFAQAAAGFVDAAIAVQGLVVDMRYFGSHN